MRGAAVVAAVALLLAACAGPTGGRRWGHPVTVREVVYLSQHGVEPEAIIAKMNRGGTVYLLSDAQLESLRGQGVTPMVIDYMRQTLVQAEAQHPRLRSDEDLSCFYMGADGFWYAGGPRGFHPDC